MQETASTALHRTARVQSLDRGIAILDAVAASGGTMSVQELSRDLQLTTSTVSRLAATLRDHGLLTQDRAAGRYGLGLELLRYARIASIEHPLPIAAAPTIERLLVELDETISLSVPTEAGMLYVRSDAPEGRMVTIRISVGNTLPYTTTAAGKAVLAAQRPAVLDTVLRRGFAKRTDASLTTETALREQVARVRKRGYATEFGESSPEVAWVAVAIIGRRGDPVGALSCNLAATGATADRVEFIANRLVSASREVQAALRRL